MVHVLVSLFFLMVLCGSPVALEQNGFWIDIDMPSEKLSLPLQQAFIQALSHAIQELFPYPLDWKWQHQPHLKLSIHSVTDMTNPQAVPELKTERFFYNMLSEWGTLRSYASQMDYFVFSIYYETTIKVTLSTYPIGSSDPPQNDEVSDTQRQQSTYRSSPLNLPQNAVSYDWPFEYKRLPDSPNIDPIAIQKNMLGTLARKLAIKIISRYGILD